MFGQNVNQESSLKTGLDWGDMLILPTSTPSAPAQIHFTALKGEASRRRVKATRAKCDSCWRISVSGGWEGYTIMPNVSQKGVMTDPPIIPCFQVPHYWVQI